MLAFLCFGMSHISVQCVCTGEVRERSERDVIKEVEVGSPPQEHRRNYQRWRNESRMTKSFQLSVTSSSRHHTLCRLNQPHKNPNHNANHNNILGQEWNKKRKEKRGRGGGDTVGEWRYEYHQIVKLLEYFRRLKGKMSVPAQLMEKKKRICQMSDVRHSQMSEGERQRDREGEREREHSVGELFG